MQDEALMREEAAYAAASADALAGKPPELALDTLGARLVREFSEAELARRPTELRWLEDLRQFKGIYSAEVLGKIGEKRSRAYVRKTRVKVITTDARVMDLLFPAGAEDNWSVGPTPKPSISDEHRAEIVQMLQQQLQRQPSQLEYDNAVRGMVEESAKRMGKVIKDQLGEANYKAVCKRAVHSGHLYGTGIVKGPLVERRIRTRFVKEGGRWIAKTESYVIPFIDFVPLWRFYPDMTVTKLKDARYAYERHRMSRHAMLELAERPKFDREKLLAHLEAHPDGNASHLHHDDELRNLGERTSTDAAHDGQYEILERWGWLDGCALKEAGVDVPEERKHESFFSNVWMLPNGEIVKAVLQPIDGTTWPYHIYYLDQDETSIFGEGLASVMRDDQTMLNAAVRLMLDNAALTAGPQLEVVPSLLSSQERITEMAPWKIWLRNSTLPGQQAVRAIELPSRLNELTALAQLFDQNADETTLIPRYMTGENVSSGAAGTASGMSMLMGAVNIAIKDLVASWDEVTKSFIQALYCWNMKFHADDSIKGDYDCVARGTASLVAKEVRARALNEFAQLTANPLDAPYVKRDALNRARAEALELSDVVKTAEEVKEEQASQMAQLQQQMQLQAAQLQLAEGQAKVAKLAAEAEMARRKADEVVANIELLVAKAVATRVEAAYAALQAGGVATTAPMTAPAGDEILRSAGWRDATPATTMAMLDRPPVQPGPDPVPPGYSAQPDVAVPPHLQPQTGMLGRREGIETPEIDG